MRHLMSFLLVLSLLGCDGGPISDAGLAEAGLPDAAPPDAGPPVPPGAGDLLIEEVYYAGAPPGGGTERYFSDQFLELVNTSERPLDLAGVGIGDAFGVAGPINPGTTTDSYRDELPDRVVLSSLWRLPSGTVLAPGGRLVVAHDGVNHRPFSVVDASGADFEAFVDNGRDDDSPTVRNLESVLFGGGIDWLVPVFGASLVVLEAGAPMEEIPGPFGPLASLPAASVLDGVDALMDADSGAFKRLPDSIDTGHASVSGTYTGESLRRRRDESGWVDTNDSSVDFELATPEPGLPPAPGQVAGTPQIELGTGVSTFAGLVDGAELELVAGIQGGWHLDVATRGSGFGPEGVTLTYDAVRADATPISLSTTASLRERGVLPTAEGWDRVGDRVVMDISDPSEVVGQTVVIRVSAALGDARANDERTVTVVDLED